LNRWYRKQERLLRPEQRRKQHKEKELRERAEEEMSGESKETLRQGPR